MSEGVVDSIEHVIVALAALGGAFFAYRKANGHTKDLEERVEKLEEEEDG